MFKRTRYTESEFIEAVKNAKCVRDVLKALKIPTYGSSYNYFYKRVKYLNLDISHFNGKAIASKKLSDFNKNSKISLQEYLSNQREISGTTLKKRLFEEKIFEEKCYRCNLTQWQNEKIPLELEHIDGNRNNNSLDNLTILCPNCHAQTDTYKGKNCKKYLNEFVTITEQNTKVKANKQEKTIQTCLDCNNECSKEAKRCRRCAAIESHKNSTKKPTLEELLKDKEQLKSYVQIGKKYGVSDNAVRKWFKFYKLL